VSLQRSRGGNQHSVIEALPAASLLQTPGARADATTWCDESGHVWLFGGEGYDDNVSSVQPRLLNDLWLFNTSRLEWNVVYRGGVIQPTFSITDAENTKSVKGEAQENGTSTAPEPRKIAASCGVPGIVFVIFGGLSSGGSSLSDTWIYAVQKARWLPLSGSIRPWSTTISWCHVDALYVIGNSTDNIAEMWKFSLRTLRWSNESLYLVEQHRCTVDSLPATQHSSANSVTVVWNGTLYLYQWQIIRGDPAGDSLMFSVNLQRWQSLPSAEFMNNWHSTPILWSHLNSYNIVSSDACSSVVVFQRRSYQIKSSTSLPEQRLHTSSWFYEGNMYIYGGEAVVNGSRTFFNDLYVLQQSFGTNSTYIVLVLTLVIVPVVLILLGFSVFCIIRYRDYRHGRKKSRELRIRYMPLRDLSLYE